MKAENKVASAVKELRAIQGLSMAKFADSLHAGLSTIQRWEAGSFLPNTDMLVRLYFLAKELGREDLAAKFVIAGSPESIRTLARSANAELSEAVIHMCRGIAHELTQIDCTGSNLTADQRAQLSRAMGHANSLEVSIRRLTAAEGNVTT